MTALPVLQPPPTHSVEGIARVVSVVGDQIWLEPEQTTSCGHCASSASCGTREAAGVGTVASRLQARRFVLETPDGLGGGQKFSEGDRLVVGVSERALLKAALTAYGLPLLFALVSASVVQGLYGEDATTLLGMLGGLALGLLAARLNARRLAAKGELAPRFVRRARPDETCGTV
ncbi:SoxR reducing system RseC family protein [Dechloromonas sp. XY25]|uniref:SoxR reducing system RseC family protein n=1 Tax=Dechloromonas hankyongensis TaxID=2908002 RepID=A0ABS9K1J9_9RHOO|nr:SoxR reducing system RseC family protein [Dechloromonas hankyongensis]MCG2577028.1 SoxR reducing system RseC family protein [Dechloromonas hankyongensis]